jgi:hypothetical protein
VERYGIDHTITSATPPKLQQTTILHGKGYQVQMGGSMQTTKCFDANLGWVLLKPALEKLAMTINGLAWP